MSRGRSLNIIELNTPHHIGDAIVEWHERDEDGRCRAIVRCDRFQDRLVANSFFEKLGELYRHLGEGAKLQCDEENSIVLIYRGASPRTVLSLIREAISFSTATT